MTTPHPQPSDGAEEPNADDYLAWSALAGAVAQGSGDLTLRDIPLLMLVDAVTMMSHQLKAQERRQEAAIAELADIAGFAVDGLSRQEIASLAAATANERPDLMDRAKAAFLQLRSTPELESLLRCGAAWNAWLGRSHASHGLAAEPGDGLVVVAFKGQRHWLFDAGDAVFVRARAARPPGPDGEPDRNLVMIPKDTPVAGLAPVLAHAAERWTAIAKDLQATEPGDEGMPGL